MTTARAVTTTAYAAVCAPTRQRGQPSQPSRPADQPTSATSSVDLKHSSHTEGYYAGIRVVAAPPAFTSHDCSGCGECVPERLRARTPSCPSCGQVLDRDENADVNILRAGPRAVVSGFMPTNQTRSIEQAAIRKMRRGLSGDG
jgi:predicted RNA-binding Zn-ribbon protein involved in translation (DUF1610 family)